MGTLYIESYSNNSEDLLEVNLETLIVLHVYKFCISDEVSVKVLWKNVKRTSDSLFEIANIGINCEKIGLEDVPMIASYCTWPVVVTQNFVVAGLASVARQIIKSSEKEEIKSLLGFREACLMACSETSIWTKFCEIDIPGTVKDVIENLEQYFKDDGIHLPTHLSRFECHMEQPIRIHNVYKLARIKNNDKLIKSNVPIEQLNLGHNYGEGPFLTLSDLLLYPCYNVFFEIFGLDLLKTELPLSSLWYKNVKKVVADAEIDFKFSYKFCQCGNFKVIQENVAKQSLYTADPKRYKPQNRIYTKQDDIDQALGLVANASVQIINNKKTFGCDVEFSWENVPVDANPTGGALPKSRANRKCQQLENLAKAIVAIVSTQSYTIVDFCSGSGHLGLLIATLLPKCHIILVENKERSLKRAQDRIIKLNLTNISLVQSNLDYFIGHFDMGMALHACGVATDLVIQTSIQNKAHFVVCPCCYGGIHDCHRLTYPRSKAFRNTLLTYRNYLIIGHSADQTHDQTNSKTSQGYVCMDVVDTDRKVHAEECGYKVILSKLSPPSCTPKNNLLVGICD